MSCRSRSGWLLPIPIAGLLASCAGELENPDRFLGCSTAYVEALFADKCGSCHGSDAAEAGLDLVSSGMTERLVGADASKTGMCSGRVLISPVGAAHLLTEKLGDAPACGDPMPVSGTLLTSAERACVETWVMATATGGTP